MDTFTPHTVSSRKRSRANDSDDHESDNDDLNKPDWNLVWSRFIVLESLNPAEPLTKLSPFRSRKRFKAGLEQSKKLPR